MSPVVVFPRLFLVAPTLLDPVDDSQVVLSPKLKWTSSASEFDPSRPGHFQLQVALDAGFTSMVIDKISFINPAGFEYENTPGNWLSLPTSGLAVVNFGKNVRYVTAFSTLTRYYWRVRSLQQV